MGLMTIRTVGKPLHDNPLNVCQTWITNPQEKKLIMKFYLNSVTTFIWLFTNISYRGQHLVIFREHSRSTSGSIADQQNKTPGLSLGQYDCLVTILSTGKKHILR